MIHELKLNTEYFPEVLNGRKTFEVRKDDRGYKEGDLLALNEYDSNTGDYTGRSCLVHVDYVLRDFFNNNFVVMSIKPCSVALHTSPAVFSSSSLSYSVPLATDYYLKSGEEINDERN